MDDFPEQFDMPADEDFSLDQGFTDPLLEAGLPIRAEGERFFQIGAGE